MAGLLGQLAIPMSCWVCLVMLQRVCWAFNGLGPCIHLPGMI